MTRYRFHIHARVTTVDWIITLDNPAAIEDSKRKIDQEYAEVIAWAETCIPESLLVWKLIPAKLSTPIHVHLYRKIMFKDDNDALAFRMRWM